MKRRLACSQSQGNVKRPIELSQDETQRLLEVFIQGKEEVFEQDCMTLIRWATEQRLRAALVDMMYAPCPRCGLPTLTGETADGTAVVLRVAAQCYTVDWTKGREPREV